MKVESLALEPGEVRDDLPEIQRILLQWFELNRRSLPWRETRDPYRILVSEVMLQQTQVDRVIPRYREFVERFPTVCDLANADTADVIREWAGLGYNRRAVNLQRAARAVVDTYEGRFPTDVQILKKLPGIGPYTAGAIACFAFEQDVGFLDTNIRRLLHRLFVGPEVPQVGLTAGEMQLLAEAIVPVGKGWSWNQALIEFGALQCTSRRPDCLACPLSRHCRAFPRIQTILRAAYRGGFRRKTEEPFDGSNRFYRGRVIGLLRAQDEALGVPLAELGPQLRDDFGAEHVRWLELLVSGLERDGLVKIAEETPAYEGSADPQLHVKLP